jgi:hypothetical protein
MAATDRSESAPAPRVPVEIAARALRHVYPGGTVALDGVDLTFGTGLFGLLGPNGAGKSTLMRIVCTLLVPTGGSVTVAGHDVVRDRTAVRGMLGYLPQEFGACSASRRSSTPWPCSAGSATERPVAGASARCCGRSGSTRSPTARSRSSPAAWCAASAWPRH